MNSNNNELKQLNSIIDYLKQKNNPSAIADKKAELLWSSDAVLWSDAIKYISYPVDTERVSAVVYNGERCPFTAVKYIITDENIEKEVFIFEIYNPKIMTQLMKKSPFFEKLKSCIDYSSIEIRKIIGLGIGLNNSLTNRKRKEQRNTIESQFLCASDLLAQSMNISCYLDDEIMFSSNEMSDAKAVLDTVCEIFREQLSRFGREITFISDASTGSVNIPERRLLLMLLNVTQNAFLYSPKKTQINIQLNFTKNKAKIKINNFKRKNIQRYEFQNAGIGLEIAKTIAEAGGGTLIYSETSKKALVEIELPVIDTSSGIQFRSSFKEIAKDRFSTVGLFLNKIIKYEMGIED